VEKDLSSRQVTASFHDRKGFIWIGTQDGLILYNANSIKIFKHDVQNKNSIVNNYIQNVCEDESALTMKGFGDAKPISDNNTLKGKANSSRVEFVKYRT